MSESSDFESVTSDLVPLQHIKDDNNIAINNIIIHTTNNKESMKFKTEIIRINSDNDSSTLDTQQNTSFTDSDHSLLEVPKLFNASSPSSICSIKPLEWDSGADVGYDIMSKQITQDMSTIERIAVSNLVYNANSTPIDYKEKISLKTKCNSLINLNGINLSKKKKSASFETVKYTGKKSDTLPKSWSPMISSLSVSTVVNKLESLDNKHMNYFNTKNVNALFEQQQKQFEKLKIDSNNEQKSSDSSSKESNSTLESADTTGSWVAKEFHDSANTTTDRVNSFEYLSGNAYNNQKDELNYYSDKEIKQRTKMLVEAMKKNGLTNESQRKKIFEKIVENFLKNYVHNDNSSSIKSESDTDQNPIRQEFTSQTSNTANTIVDNHKNNQSSTITFTSPITSSQYGDDIDSKYDEFSLDSGRHINLQKCLPKKINVSTSKQRNLGVQCSIQDSSINIDVNENVKKSESSKSKTQFKNIDNVEYFPKKHDQNKTDRLDINKEFKKQMIWFHKNYMKTERENQMLWINSQISHLNNLKKLLNTHEELKKKWNLYKQKQSTNNKSKSRRSFIPTHNLSSDISITTRTTDSTTTSKLCSVSSKYDETDTESSTTICDHVHYKKGVIVTDPKSIQKCCEKTFHKIHEKQKQNNNKFKTTWSQTESINEIKFKSNKRDLNESGATYSVNHKLKPNISKNSISYDIIFKPNMKCLKEIDTGKNKPKQLSNSMSVACQTSELPFNPKSSLQEYLMTNRPDYICRAEERQNILSDLANLRNERRKLKTNLLMSNNFEKNIPPNPLAVKRVMSQREMRKQTENKYRKCSEVKNKKVEKKRQEEFKTNKIMASIFNKRLQKKTLKGKVDLSNSVSVCSL